MRHLLRCRRVYFSFLCFYVWLATPIIIFNSNQAKCSSSNHNIHSPKNHVFKENYQYWGTGEYFNSRIKHFVFSLYKNVNYLFGSSLKGSLKSYVYSVMKTESCTKALTTCEGFSVKHHIFLFVALYTFCIQLEL